MNESRNLIQQINELMWSQDVKTHWTPPKGLFKSGNMNKIATVVGNASNSLKQAVARVNFYYNRAGSNVPNGDELRRGIVKRLRKLFSENK